MNHKTLNPVAIKNIEAFVFRAPIQQPVKTSFGTMFDRPAVFVKIEDEDGGYGWGEIWCNFPSVGAEHRARLLDSVFKPLIVHKTFSKPQELHAILTEKTSVLSIQSGEYGPISQVIAGIDTAAWDLFSRRAKQPLWKYLGGSNTSIKVYASGINPDRPEETIEKYLELGYQAFKLKVGFGAEIDLNNLHKIRSIIPDATLMVDANQAWGVKQAITQINSMQNFDLRWVEEPLRADSSIEEWREVSQNTKAIIAAGENIASLKNFEEAIESKIFGVLQPDVAKWGGLSMCQPIAKKIIQNKITYCPHYLGGGVGLLASAHLLAASGGNGYLEVDSNFNPLRDLVCGVINQVSNGQVTLSNEIGLGFQPNLDELSRYRCN